MTVPGSDVVVRTPSARWTTGWRAVAVLIGLAAAVLAARRLAVAPTVADAGWVLLRAGFAGWCATVAWRWAARPRLTRADARDLPSDHLKDAHLSVRLRHRLNRGGPLPADLRRHAVVCVARWTRYQPWLAAVGGVWMSLGLAVRGPGDTGSVVVSALFAVTVLSTMARDARTVRRAVALGAVPRVDPPPRPG